MYGMNQLWGFSINNDLILTYDKNIGDFGLNVLGGGSIAYHQDREQGAQTTNGLSIPGWYSLANAVPSTTAGIDAIKSNYGTWAQQINSLYAKASISWKGAIFLDFTGRNDWSSTQSSDQRSYFYPSVSSSVILSEFIEMPHIVDMWKVRGSWTQSKTPAGIYDNNRTFNTGLSWGMPSSGYPGNLRGNNLLPSATRTWEIGTAGYLLGERLHIVVAYFNKYYYDQQTFANISDASGFTGSLVNTKETNVRKGLEITVDGSPIKHQNLDRKSVV